MTSQKTTQKQFPEPLYTMFKEWLKDKIKQSTSNNYCSWLNQMPNYMQEESPDLSDGTQKAIKNVRYLNEYLELINKFVLEGDKMYALSVYDKMFSVVKLCKTEYPYKSDNWHNWNNRHSAFVALGDFLNEYDYKKRDYSKINKNSYNALALERNKINKSDLRPLDGMEILLAALKEDGFIQAAIKGSYFFSPDLVESVSNNLDKVRFTEDTNIIVPENNIGKDIKKGTKDCLTYTIDEKNFKELQIDSTGNNFVQQLINEVSGIRVSSGKDASFIVNTIISHVWGRAWDPRYFMSLWNIVLIPAWANSLMDKEDAVEGSLASKLRATYMAICIKLYFTKLNEQNNYWIDKLDMGSAPDVIHQQDIKHDTYQFNIIQKKCYKRDVNICSYQISV